MLKLTNEQMKTIENQMFNKSRDIDVCVFNYVTGGFPNLMVIDALSMYQNRDGGYGHGLDPDNLNPNSTVYETVVALSYMYASGFKSYKEDEDFEAVLNKIFNYLYNKKPEWSLYDPENLKFACAERFRLESSSLYSTNMILAYTIHFLDEKKPYYKKALTKITDLFSKLLNLSELSKDEALGFKLLFKVLDEKGISFDEKAKAKSIELTNKLINSLNIDNVNAYYVAMLDESRKEEALDFIINSIEKHGLWENYSEWGNTYPEAESAKLKWLGAITLKYLILLNNNKKIMEM